MAPPCLTERSGVNRSVRQAGAHRHTAAGTFGLWVPRRTSSPHIVPVTGRCAVGKKTTGSGRMADVGLQDARCLVAVLGLADSSFTTPRKSSPSTSKAHIPVPAGPAGRFRLSPVSLHEGLARRAP